MSETIAFGPIDPVRQWFANDGTPLAGGKVYTYAAGTSTPLDTFNDADLAVGHENTNPIILDAYGKAVIYLQDANYKFDVQTSAGVSIDGYPQDNIRGLSGGANTGDGLTYIARTTTYPAVAGDLVGCSGTFTVTLPDASDNPDAVIAVVNNGSGTITIARTGADTIGLATSQTLNPSGGAAQGDSMTFHSDGISNWIIL